MTSKVETAIGVIWGFFVRLALLVGVVYTLYRVRSILVAVLLSVMLTYLVLPVVEYLSAIRVRGWSYRSRRFWASSLVFIVLLAATGISVKYIVTPFIDEASDISRTAFAIHEMGKLPQSANEWFAQLPKETRALFSSDEKAKAIDTASTWINRILRASGQSGPSSLSPEDISRETAVLFDEFPDDVKAVFVRSGRHQALAATELWAAMFLKSERAHSLLRAIRDARDFQQISTRASAWVNQLPPDIKKLFGSEQQKRAIDTAARWLGGVLQSTAAWAKHFLDIILIPVLAFYFTLDYRSLRREFVGALPKRRRKEALYLLRHVGGIMENYVIGQLILCLIAGVVVGLALWGLEMNYALALGVLAGVTRAIPVIGPIISGIVIVALGLLKSPILGVYLLVFFCILHLVESKFILPKLLGHRMRLHPGVIIIVLLIGSEFFGIMGMFLAAPVAAVIRELVRFYIIAPRVKREHDESEADPDVVELPPPSLRAHGM